MSATDQEKATVSLTVGEDGQVTIPAEILDARGIEPGDTIEVEVVRDGILLTPVVTDDEMAAFWGPDWREKLDEAEADVAAGRTTFFGSDEEFLAALESLHDADGRRD